MKKNNWKFKAARILREFYFSNEQILSFIREAKNNHPGATPVVLYNATLKLAYEWL